MNGSSTLFSSRHLILLAVFLATGFALHTTWASLFAQWSKFDQAYSHGLIAVILAAVSIFQRRAEITASNMRIHVSALILLLGSSTLWFLVDFLQIQVGAQLLILPIIFLTLATIYGFKSALFLAPALFYLLFAIPVWDYINSALQQLTTLVATLAMESTGLAVLINENRITIPYGTFEIAGGCSGLRYLLVAMVLALFFAQQKPNSLSTTLKIFGVAILSGLIANWIRVTAIILIGYYSEMQSSIVADHETFGWFVFISVFIPAFLWIGLIEKKAARLTHIHAHDHHESAEKPASPSTGYIPVAAAILALALGPLLKLVSSHQQVSSQFELNSAPPTYAWHTINLSTPVWALHYPGGEILDPVHFANAEGQHIEVTGVYYRQESQGHELINDMNRLWDDRQWKPSSDALPQLGNSRFAQQVITNKHGERMLLLSYFQIGNQQLTNAFRAKLAQLHTLITPDLFQGVVVFRMPCKDDCTQQAEILYPFAQAYVQKGSVHAKVASKPSQP